MKRRTFIQQTGLFSGGLAAIQSLHARDLFSQEQEALYKVDTHMHLWDPNQLPYSWLKKSELLNRRYGVKEYQAATQHANIGKMVFVECGVDAGYNLKEVDWVVKQIEKDPRIHGIVAKSDLSSESPLEEEWEILQDNPWVKGIRSGANKDTLMDSRYVQRLRQLPEYGLSFDLHINPSAFEVAEKVIRECEQTTFILNHIGIPNIKEGEWEPWQKGITRLAQLPNLTCKISGVITRAGAGWTQAQIKPYISHIIESFGFEHIIYGGDWPVVLNAGSYQSWASAFEQLTQSFSQHELAQLYHLNAEKTYRL